MLRLKSVKNWVKAAASALRDLFVPEDARTKRLMDIPAATMRELLPRSPVYSKNIVTLFDYQNKIIRLVVKSIKYKNNASLRRRVAGYLYDELLEIASEIALFEGAPPILLPMPMSKKEKRERGFNQTEELCDEIKKLAGENIELSSDILKKTRETERQTKLSRELREQNVKNSMAVDTNVITSVITDRVCIVLDDVYTTGASLAEARRALLAAGAKRVIGLFIAH